MVPEQLEQQLPAPEAMPGGTPHATVSASSTSPESAASMPWPTSLASKRATSAPPATTMTPPAMVASVSGSARNAAAKTTAEAGSA